MDRKSGAARRLWWGVLGSALLLGGCAGNPFRSYDAELQETVAHVRQGELEQALTLLEKNNASLFSGQASAQTQHAPAADGAAPPAGGGSPADDGLAGKDILYYFEKGELLALKGDYAGSRDAWLVADGVVREWEEGFKADPSKFFGDMGSYLVSDRVRRYDGQDYEKVFLSARLTLDHILTGRFDDARVEMKKTYEREKLIEQFRELEYAKLAEEKESQNVSADADADDLAASGYPLAELDTPEVRELKNGYQNAFAHYLAGYFFEMTGEPSLAEPGYRNALVLRPGSRYIEQKLAGEAPRAGAGEADVLFVVESGFAPAWQSLSIPLPIPTGGGRIVATPLSFPIVRSDEFIDLPTQMHIGGRSVPVETLVNVDTLARRLLKDQLPTITLRTLIRAAVKSVMQDQAQRQGGLLAGLVAAAISVATEQADERAWRTLPARVAIGRTVLPMGEHVLEIPTRHGLHKAGFQVSQRLTVVPIRLTGEVVYVGQQDQAAVGAALPAFVPEAPANKPSSSRKRSVRPAPASQ